MVIDLSGNYVVQSSQPPQGEWYATSMGLVVISAIVVAATSGSLFAYSKALRK